MNQIKIGKFICKMRKEKKLTQEELSEKLKISKNAISKWETGKNMPDYSLIKELCDELNITINELLLGEKIEENILSIFKNTKASKEEKIISRSLSASILIIVIVSCILYKYHNGNEAQLSNIIITFTSIICVAISWIITTFSLKKH